MARFTWVVIALLFLVEMLLGANHVAKAPEDASSASLCQAIFSEIKDLENVQTPESTIVRILTLKSWARLFAPNRPQLDQVFGHGKTLEDFEMDSKPFIKEKKEQVPDAVLEYLDRWDTEINYVKKQISAANEHKKDLVEERESIETKKGKLEAQALQKEFEAQEAIDKQQGVPASLEQEFQAFSRRIKSYETDIDRVNILLKDADKKNEDYSEKLILYGTLKELLLNSYVKEFNIKSDASKKLKITSSDGSTSHIYDYSQLETLSQLLV